MKRKINKKVVAIAMSLLVLGGIASNGVNTHAANVLVSKTILQTKTVNFNITKSIKYRPSVPGSKTYPSTSDWKSSNSKIATVASTADKNGYHKISIKKKGTVTISCVASNSSNYWRKGDRYKLSLEIK